MTATSLASESHEPARSPSTMRRRHQVRLLQHFLARELRGGELELPAPESPEQPLSPVTAFQQAVHQAAAVAAAAPEAAEPMQCSSPTAESGAPLGTGPIPECAFLRPGQSFEGRQRVAQLGLRKNEHWGVHVTIQGYDAARGYVCGTMEANNVPEAAMPVTTFFEGEIVDGVNHYFYTADWQACAQTDLRHWSKLVGFSALHLEVLKSGGRCSRLHTHPYIYMRWKERFFVKGSESRLTIAGFYYVCINRVDGRIEGLYYDPSSAPDQKLELDALTADAGHAFGHYDMA